MFERFQENVNLAPHTTMGVGGPARWFYECEDPRELPEIRAALYRESLPLAVLGGGSNLLYPDGGFPGLILKIAWAGVKLHEDAQGYASAKVAAGEVWDAFVLQCVEGGLAGVECLAGIPGLVGAVPIQNVGAYGQEVAETITRVAAFDLREGDFTEFAPDECDFGYRRSRFKYADKGRFIITEVDFRLSVNGTASLRYGELKQRLDELALSAEGGREQLMAVRDTVLKLRRGKGMVIDPADPDSRSCGSFFTNPVIGAARYADFRERCIAKNIDPDGAPAFAQGELRKLSAAWLVERAGFHKGFARGAAGVSNKHSLALINRGGARTQDILELAAEIRTQVREQFGVDLEREPVLQSIES